MVATDNAIFSNRPNRNPHHPLICRYV